MLGSEGARRAAPTTFNSLIYTHAGEITPQMVAWLSSIKQKDLNNCGKFVLTGDMSQLSITKVDLSNMNTLEGRLVLWGQDQLCAMPKRCQSNTLIVELSCLLKLFSTPTSPLCIHAGNIQVFEGMAITNMNLERCYKLTGEWCVSWVGLGGRVQDQ